MGNSARSIDVAGKRCLLAWKGQTMLAMGASCGFSRSSCGYVGTSDGYQDLYTDMKMSWQFGQALNGNIAVMGEIEVAEHREFTIAIAFGDGNHAAVAQMMQTLSTPYIEHQKRFLLQWSRAVSPPRLSSASKDGGKLMRISFNTLLTHEDKTYSGAFIASASIPWGNAKGARTWAGITSCGRATWCRRLVR